jgi:branched-chain amino acid transport system substrate-binding protein
MAGLAGMCLVLSACGGSAQGEDSGDGGGGIPDGPIKVGIIAALSGPGAAYGNLVVSQHTALVDYINERGGVAGHDLELVVENSEGNPALAVAGAHRLVEAGVVATFYNGSSNEGKAQAIAIEQQAGIVGIGPESLPEYDDPGKYPYYFNDNAHDTIVTTSLAAFVADRDFGAVGLLGDSLPFSASLMSEFTKAADDAGVEVVDQVDYPANATTMTTQLAQLRDQGTETLGLFCLVGCAKVFDSLRQLDWAPTIIGAGTLYWTAYDSVQELGDRTYSYCSTSATADGEVPDAVTEAILTLAPASGGVSNTSMTLPQNLDAYLLFKHAVEQAESTDGDALREAIESIEDVSFDSNPQASYTFSSEHHAGYHPNTDDGLIPICGFEKLTPDTKLPYQVS